MHDLSIATEANRMLDAYDRELELAWSDACDDEEDREDDVATNRDAEREPESKE